MKILLISPINPHVETETRYPQLGLGYLVSYIRKNLGKDRFLFKIITNKVEENLNKFKPDLIGISSFTQNYGIVKKYAALCKKRGLPIIVGGIHISLMPESLSADMDVGVLQEGEQTMVELVKLYEKTQRFDADELAAVKGVVYRRDNHLVFTEPRPLINNIDDIPFPARELLNVRGTHLSMFTSRGCPYRCVFCASSRFWTKTRFASAPYIAEEIMELYYNYGAKLISFYDDLFVINKERISDLIEILASEGLLGKVRFSCSARANLINDETVKLLKELGVVSLALGLESGHPRTLKYLKGPSVTVSDNTNAVKTLDQNCIAPNAAFIIGSAKETKEEIMTTYNFIKSVPLRNFNIYVMTPFPGTPIWTQAIEQGSIGMDFDQWEILDAVHFSKYYKRAIIVSQVLSRKELYKLYKKFQQLRYWVFLRNAYRHPFIKDIPKMFLALVKEWTVGIVKNENTLN